MKEPISRYYAQRRLKEVELELKYKIPWETSMRAISSERLELIQERIDLKNYLGHFDNPRLPIGMPVANIQQHLIKEKTVEIIFHEKPITNKITFSMVQPGQLFVGNNGALYQRASDDEDENLAWEICDSNGDAAGETESFDEYEEIKRVLPPINRIIF